MKRKSVLSSLIVLILFLLLTTSLVGAQDQTERTKRILTSNGNQIYAIGIDKNEVGFVWEASVSVKKDFEKLTSTGLLFGFDNDSRTFKVRGILGENPQIYTFKRIASPSVEDTAYVRTNDGRDVFAILYQDMAKEPESRYRLTLLEYSDRGLSLLSIKQIGFFCNQVVLDANLNALLGCESLGVYSVFDGQIQNELKKIEGLDYDFYECNGSLCLVEEKVDGGFNVKIWSGNEMIANFEALWWMSLPRHYDQQTAIGKDQMGDLTFTANWSGTVFDLLPGTYAFDVDLSLGFVYIFRDNEGTNEFCAREIELDRKWNCAAVKSTGFAN